MVIIYSILGGILRRIYGGWLEAYKVIKNRGVQTVLMIGLFLAIYMPHYKWYISLVIACWLQFQFWSRFHGGVFDEGRGEKTQETIDRCNKYWWHYPVDFIFKLLKAEDKKHGFLYDFSYMTFRYTCPMIPMMFFDWRYILIGLSISPIYAFCWTLFEREKWLFKNNFCGNATNLAEILSGAVVYGGCYLLGV